MFKRTYISKPFYSQRSERPDCSLVYRPSTINKTQNQISDSSRMFSMRKMPHPWELNAFVPCLVESLHVSRHRREGTRIGIAADESRWNIDRAHSTKRRLL